MPLKTKLGKPTDQRMAMLRQQVTDLLTYGKLETTIDRAKAVKPLAEKMITLGKKNTLASYRQALSFLTKEEAAHRTFHVPAPIYADRNGGYTRILRLGARRGDAAEMAIICLVDEDKIMARIRENSAKPVKKSKFQLRLEEMQKQQQQQLKQQNRK